MKAFFVGIAGLLVLCWIYLGFYQFVEIVKSFGTKCVMSGPGWIDYLVAGRVALILIVVAGLVIYLFGRLFLWLYSQWCCHKNKK